MYYEKQDLPTSSEFSSPANHQNATVNAKEDYFSYLGDDDAARENINEVAAYLSERLKSALIENFIAITGKGFKTLSVFTKIRLFDNDMGIESGDTNIDDDLEFRAEITSDIDDKSDEIIMDNEEKDHSCNSSAD